MGDRVDRKSCASVLFQLFERLAKKGFPPLDFSTVKGIELHESGVRVTKWAYKCYQNECVIDDNEEVEKLENSLEPATVPFFDTMVQEIKSRTCPQLPSSLALDPVHSYYKNRDFNVFRS